VPWVLLTPRVEKYLDRILKDHSKRDGTILGCGFEILAGGTFFTQIAGWEDELSLIDNEAPVLILRTVQKRSRFKRPASRRFEHMRIAECGSKVGIGAHDFFAHVLPVNLLDPIADRGPSCGLC
jgi:hypothetical protein